ICDPEAEYVELTKALGGVVVDISATSQHHLNPFDINLNSDDEDPVSVKSQFILSICEAAIGGKYGLSAAEKSVIDRCVRRIYEKYLENPVPENIPIFQDLYNELTNQKDNEHAQRITDSLEIFVTGSLSIFNSRTNVDIDNRVICFNIKKLSKHLHKMGILAIIDHVWNMVSQGRDEKKHTYFYIDEFHLVLHDEQTAEYSVAMWKRFRKWLALPTGITQNVTDILLSPEIENILKNSAFIILLGQASGDRELVDERLGISPQEMEYITDTGVGEGLIYYNDKYLSGSITPFKDVFPTNTKLYQIMNTSYDE
ncbi:MAG: conjugal transfer protein TraE, partial [Oscillospiraceae bacterium]|nr:conjugal transfer protein TraE [Oscillospiraceae bacterium]